ncbi:uncharacterized protein AB675_11857 [Cyphellophora attinorum]|uniref:Heterokaryon incompatibility domain-containing protein n=1 Tax=Cyphellophora attinorum TaxID=1664694 RepID=A0A0N1HJT7_9EURO|nr:uncharacterized protein AB675_11857 [Phialophora attinorum]KPI36843.1 hypothetical protein AB675_11857 [Phialophora attinorum]
MDLTHDSDAQATHDMEPAIRRFSYPYLPNDGQHFRLLQLFQDDEEASIRCELFTARRSDWKEQYFAMSYVWGSKDNKAEIILNERSFPLRRNLFDFLKAFRAYMMDCGLPWAIIWADAICIDQETIDEKNHQVQVMSRIFHDAACVFSWLGYGDAILKEQSMAFVNTPWIRLTLSITSPPFWKLLAP